MIKIIIFITIVINFSICGFAQERYIKSEVLDFIKKEIKTNNVYPLNIHSENLKDNKSYLLISTGLGYYKDSKDSYGIIPKRKARICFDIDMTLLFKNRIFLSLKFDRFSNTEREYDNWTFLGLVAGQYLNIYLFTEARWYIGMSFSYNAGNKESGNAFPFVYMLNTKLEYDLSKWTSANLEIRPIIAGNRFDPIISLNFAVRFGI
jgi:hypothetical protein